MKNSVFPPTIIICKDLYKNCRNVCTDHTRVIVLFFESTGAIMLDHSTYFEHLVQAPLRPDFVKVNHFIIKVFF